MAESGILTAPGARSRAPAPPRRWFDAIAESRLAVPVMALLSLLDACISPVLPEVLLVPLCLARPARRWVYAAWCAGASVAGAAVGYYLGMTLWESGLRDLAFEYVPGLSAQSFETASQRFGEGAFWWIVVAAFTPLPFKAFTIAAGLCHDQVSIGVLLAASVAGRLPRFFLEVEVIRLLGPQVKRLTQLPAWVRVATVSASALGLVYVLS